MSESNKCVQIPDNITTFIVEIPYYISNSKDRISSFKFRRQIILEFKPYLELKIKFSNDSNMLQISNIYYDYDKCLFVLSCSQYVPLFDYKHIWYFDNKEWNNFLVKAEKPDSNYELVESYFKEQLKISNETYVSKISGWGFANERTYYHSPKTTIEYINSVIKTERNMFEKINFEFEILSDDIKKIYNGK